MDSSNVIDPKQAVQIAKKSALDMLGLEPINLEEIERESYKGQDVWNITLSFATEAGKKSPLTAFGRSEFQYKRFLIGADHGNLIAIKLRELASQ